MCAVSMEFEKNSILNKPIAEIMSKSETEIVEAFKRYVTCIPVLTVFEILNK